MHDCQQDKACFVFQNKLLSRITRNHNHFPSVLFSDMRRVPRGEIKVKISIPLTRETLEIDVEQSQDLQAREGILTTRSAKNGAQHCAASSKSNLFMWHNVPLSQDSVYPSRSCTPPVTQCTTRRSQNARSTQRR